jgi:hypothetical protein
VTTGGKKLKKMLKLPNRRPDLFVLENELPGLQDRVHTEEFHIG